MKKKAEDLKRGDVVVFADKGASSLLCFVSTIFPGEPIEGQFARHATGDVFRTEIHPGHMYEVESPALTPAQQHAEELLTLARNVMEAGLLAPVRDEARALLARIDPPKPPSAEELAQALADSIECSECTLEHNSAVKMLERARAAGMLKDGAQ